MKRLAAALAGALVSMLSVAVAQNAPQDPKQLAAQVQQLLAEGKSLEQQGKLTEAKDRYVDAEGLAPGSEAESAIRHIDERWEQQVASLLAEAHRLFAAGKFSDSADRLEQALNIQPARPVLHYDLALCYLKLGDRTDAALHLDPAIALLQGKERAELLQLRSAVLIGTTTPKPPAEPGKAMATFNDSYSLQNRARSEAPAPGGSLCAQTTQLLSAVPENPAVLFNSAKCAAQDGRAGDAAHLLVDYTRLAPEALDHADSAAMQQVWSSLASLPGDSGQAVRSHYAAASRDLDARHYNLAIADYQAAAQALPDFPQTQWELALLHEATGDTTKAAEHFARLQTLEPSSERAAAANTHVSTFARRHALYDADVSEAQDILAGLVRRSLSLDDAGTHHETGLTFMQWRHGSQEYKAATRATQKLPQAYVMRELDRASDELLDATVLFPLGAEANELLALIALQDNDWTEAYNSYDAVASQGVPVSFYAQVQSEHDGGIVHAAKVEIATDAVRLIYLASYDLKKQTTAPPANPAGSDKLGDLVVSALEPRTPPAEALTIRAGDLQGIETDQNFVVLKRKGDKIYLAPLNMLSDTPFLRGDARAFGNAYTSLFVRYFGYQNARLGTEGWTAGETLKVGLVLASAALPTGFLGLGAAASAARAARLAHAARGAHAARAARAGRAGHPRRRARDGEQGNPLQEYAALGKDIHLAKAGDTADELVSDEIEPATLERTAADQQRTLKGLLFKVIPTGPAATTFRDRF